MKNKKYRLTDEKIEYKGRVLYRIQALRNFGDIKAGDLGGFVQSEYNLSHSGDCWIYNNAKAMDNSEVLHNSEMYDYSEMYDNAKMYDSSEMYDNSSMHDNSIMYDNSKMYNNSTMYDNSEINGYSEMYYNSVLKNNEKLYGTLYSKVDKFIEVNVSNGKLITIVKKNNKILFNIGCQKEITAKEFLYKIHNEKGGIIKNPHRNEYLKIINVAKLLIGE